MKIRLAALALTALLFGGCTGFLVYGPADYRNGRGQVLREFSAEEAAQIQADWRSRPQDLADLALARLVASGESDLLLLARALSRLPDLGEALTPEKARAAGRVADLALTGDEQIRPRLEDLADENISGWGFSGPLQGLLWLAEHRDLAGLSPEQLDPDELLDYAWRELFQRMATPRQVLDYLALEYTYVLDRRFAQPARRFFRRKFGDCTEFTLLAGRLLKAQGYPVVVLLCRPTTLGGHTAIIYRTREGYFILDASRAAIARTLAFRRRQVVLGPVDARVWREMKSFDRIIGPYSKLKDTIRPYEEVRGGRVLHRFLSFEEYSQFIEAHAREDMGWWRF